MTEFAHTTRGTSLPPPDHLWWDRDAMASPAPERTVLANSFAYKPDASAKLGPLRHWASLDVPNMLPSRGIFGIPRSPAAQMG